MAAGPDLTGEVVLVTGASRGLGRALAEAYGRAGAALVLCARGEEELGEVGSALSSSGVAVEWAAADVSDARAMESLVRRAEERLGPVSVLVNNASVLSGRAMLRDVDPEDWRAVLAVNLTGAFIAARTVLPSMRRTGRGSIINVTSGVGNRARPRWGPYAVSKWGLEGLSQNLAVEEADAGIRVNLVDPGRLRTDMRQAAYPEEDPAEQTPPEDVAGVFLWLASSGSAGVTGRRFIAPDWRGDP